MYCGHCPWTTVSLITAIIFVTVECMLHCEYAPGLFAEYMWQFRSAVSAGGVSALCLIYNTHCSEALPFQKGRNQPGNSFPNGFKAWSWNSSLLAVIQHRAVCSSSLASNRVLSSCSHWFRFMLVKFLSVCFTETCTSRYVMKRSCRLDAKCIAVAGWEQFC